MALGKNLNNLLGDYFGNQEVNLSPELQESQKAEPESLLSLQEIDLTQIDISPFQTRKKFDIEKIKALSQSIEENGLVHPITVLQKSNPDDEKKYILLAGERRLRAVKLLGLQTIPAVIRRQLDLSEENQATFTAIENLHREDLNPIELAHTFEILMHAKTVSEEGLAQFLGKSAQYIKNYLRLLTLDGMLQKMLTDGELTEGQARYLVPLSPEMQRKIATIIVAKKLTVKEIIALIAEENKPKEEIAKIPQTSKNHNLPLEIIQKVDKIAQLFSNSKMQCLGDENQGKIVISWKKPTVKLSKN